MNVIVRQGTTDASEGSAVGTPTVRQAYIETIRLIERAHRRFLDVVKDELERMEREDINNVQAVLLHSVGEEELTPSELKSRGYYLGSNVSYNLKKLGELGYLKQRRSRTDRRTVRIMLTERGAEVALLVEGLLDRHMSSLGPIGGVDEGKLADTAQTLRRLDRYWKDQVLYRL